MIYRDTEILEFNDLHGGTGLTVIRKHVTEGVIARLDMFANVVLEPGASIGYHQHLDESEIYHIISGEAEFTDSDKSVKQVTAGDCCVIEKGESHGIKNTGDSFLEFIAAVF